MTTISLPNQSIETYRNITRPLLAKLKALGFPVTVPALKTYQIATPELHAAVDNPESNSQTLKPRALGDRVGNTVIASRLWPRTNFETPQSISEMNAVIRATVSSSTSPDGSESGGYTFHGQNYAPTLAVSGNPNNAVNLAFRNTVMHAQAYEADATWDTLAPVRSWEEQRVMAKQSRL